jgi:sterol desaturase/sphingolipid hydroxylase (fatty acid hydroxylase superfamily)
MVKFKKKIIILILNSSGLSAHYMSFLDFVLENLGGYVTGMILLNYYQGPSLSFIMATVPSAFHTVCVHSGWKFWFLPDPTRHYIHHTKQNCNYGLGPLDRYFNTEIRKI